MMGQLDTLRSHKPEVAPMTDQMRHRARADLARAIQAEARPARRTGRRLAAAATATIAVAIVMVVGTGSPPADDAPSRPWLLGPQPAGALTAVERNEGSTEIRFLHPTADPDRIRAELEQHGFDIDVTFVAADPFAVGTLVMYGGDPGIDTIREGEDLTGGGHGQDVAIVVPDGWSGSAQLGIGRSALPGERFATGVALNAERPGGPLHCAGVRGLPAPEAASHVAELGFRVEWRTHTRNLTGDRHDPEPPPADYLIHDLEWTASDEIMLFAAAGQPPQRSAAVTELISRGCERGGE
jgi:hypothetical protein